MKLLKVILTTFILSFSITQQSQAGEININILMPAPFANSTKDIINSLNKSYKGDIQVNVTRGPMETESVSDLAISSLILGDSPYDIVLIDITWLAKYAEAGWLVNMDRLIKNEKWNSLTNGAKVGNSYNNSIYRIPLNADMGLLYWRKDIVKKPPRTPEELIKISLDLQSNNKIKYGFVWQGRQYEGLSCFLLEILNGFGGSWIDANNKVNIDNTNNIKAISWLLELISKGITPKAVTNFAENEALQLFKAGDAAFMRNWPYAWNELQKDESDVKGKVGITTMFSNKNGKRSSTLGSWGFSILKTTKKKEAAMKVIDYITSSESQIKLFKEYGYTPTIKSLFDNKELLSNSPELLNALKRGLEITVARPSTPFYTQISDVLQRNISAILTNKISIKQGLINAEYKTNQILSSTGVSR